MSVSYTSILWNKNKKRYDALLAIGIVLFISFFLLLNSIIHPQVTYETNIIRAFGWLAILLLHIILLIGPLARLHAGFLIVLYNRRHLGVTMFFMALIHGGFSIIQFHGLGDMHPLRSLFLSNTNYDSLIYFPFQVLGFLALILLALMAASSHDFWLKNLGVRTWKALHMMVYLVYGLLVMHVLLGGLQNEKSPVLFGMIAIGFVTVSGLHLWAGWKEWQKDKHAPESDDWLDAGLVEAIEENRAVSVVVGDDRVAIYKYDGQLSAVHNVCKHQGGPLSEGKIIDGCITCPWHGYQYLPNNGQSPPPFTEKVATYPLKVEDGRLYIQSRPMPPGTHIDPVRYE